MEVNERKCPKHQHDKWIQVDTSGNFRVLKHRTRKVTQHQENAIVWKRRHHGYLLCRNVLEICGLWIAKACQKVHLLADVPGHHGQLIRQDFAFWDLIGKEGSEIGRCLQGLSNSSFPLCSFQRTLPESSWLKSFKCFLEDHSITNFQPHSPTTTGKKKPAHSQFSWPKLSRRQWVSKCCIFTHFRFKTGGLIWALET